MPPFIEGILGVDIPDQYDHLVTIMTMILAIYGVSHTFKRIFPDKQPEKLQADYDRLINVAGDYIHIAPQNLKNTVFERKIKMSKRYENMNKRHEYMKRQLDKKGYITRDDVQKKFKISSVTFWQDIRALNLICVNDKKKYKYILDISFKRY